MTLERMPGPMAPEPAPPAIGDGSGGSPVALRLQVLANEHWGLLATRSLVWNESFTRAGMFLTTLTGSIVALALVAQATAFGEDFSLFALVVLAVVLFIGLATYSRLGAAIREDREARALSARQKHGNGGGHRGRHLSAENNGRIAA